MTLPGVHTESADVGHCPHIHVWGHIQLGAE